MYPILEARFLAPDVKYFRIQAPKIARKRKAGQFVILRAMPDGERIPLTIADSDPEDGWITLIVQGIGRTTKFLNTLEAGDHVVDVAGPLGMASHIENFGTAVSIGGGVGTAIAYPTAVALKQGGNHVISIIGGRVILVVIFDERSSLGLVRLRVKKASDALCTLFREIEKHAADSGGDGSPFDEITDDDIDNLFSE